MLLEYEFASYIVLKIDSGSCMMHTQKEHAQYLLAVHLYLKRILDEKSFPYSY